jgi:hypothetical protein
MGGIEAVHQGVIGLREKVAVAVQSESDTGVAGPGRHLLSVRPLGDPERHRSMPEVVRT